MRGKFFYVYLKQDSGPEMFYISFKIQSLKPTYKSMSLPFYFADAGIF